MPFGFLCLMSEDGCLLLFLVCLLDEVYQFFQFRFVVIHCNHQLDVSKFNGCLVLKVSDSKDNVQQKHHDGQQ